MHENNVIINVEVNKGIICGVIFPRVINRAASIASLACHDQADVFVTGLFSLADGSIDLGRQSFIELK